MTRKTPKRLQEIIKRKECTIAKLHEKYVVPERKINSNKKKSANCTM